MTSTGESFSGTLRRTRERLTLMGAAAVACLALAALVLATTVPGVIRAAGASRAPEVGGPQDQESRAKRHSDALAGHRAQIDGRSPFFVPAAPPAPERAPVEAPEDRGPPPAPSSYAGPKLAAIVGESVWFEGGARAMLGGDAVEGVRVVSLAPPWSARLLWRGAEFDVTLFERTTGRSPSRAERIVPGTMRL